MAFPGRPGRARQRRVAASATQIDVLEQRVLLSGTAIDASQLEDLSSSPGDHSGESAPIDGVGNNLSNEQFGAANTPLLRVLSTDYGDGLSTPAGTDRPSAREVSNAIAAVESSITNDRYLTDYVWIWGQFIDHDIDLTENAVDDQGDPLEPLPIAVPQGDPFFDPDGTGTGTIDFNRSISEVDANGVRQQINQITAFLDGSVVYGSDTERAEELRTHSGGLLKTSEGDLLPFNEAGLENAGGSSADLFLAGDVRANENVVLSAMHTIWVREHNRIAAELAAEDPGLSDEQLYQQARAIVTGQLQAITYNEFLPALLGYDAIGEYSGYDDTVDPGISNVFSTAAYRFGHSLLSPVLQRVDADGNAISDGGLALQSAFFNPEELIEHGVDPLLRGAATQLAQELDNQVVDDVRNFLFGPPGAGGFDLASLNIQRGRDHGLPDYNQARVDLGLSAVASFSDITSNTELATRLEEVYGDVNHIDLWVGGLAEDHLPGSSMGELFSTIIADQFERIRSGDRFWYENVFSGRQLYEIDSTTLADVIERNTDIAGLQENVFLASSVTYVNLTDVAARDVTVRSRDGQVEVFDNEQRRVISSRPAADVDQVIIVGSADRRERVTVEAVDASQLPGGVVLSFGDTRGDELRVRGTRDADSFSVTDGYIELNGLPVRFTGTDRPELEVQRDLDIVDVPADVEVDLVSSRSSERHQDTGKGRNERHHKRGATEIPHPRRTDDRIASSTRRSQRRR